MKDLEKMSRNEISLFLRKESYKFLKDNVSKLGEKTFIRKGLATRPNMMGLMLKINKKVKAELGYGLDEADKTNDTFLNRTITTLRDDLSDMMNIFQNTWDGTDDHYTQFKNSITKNINLTIQAYKEKVKTI